MKRKIILLVNMLLCVTLFCGCNDSSERPEAVSDRGVKEDITEESEEVGRAEKGYGLPVSDSEQEEAEDDCKKMMGLISELYQNAEKGNASNAVISDEIMHHMAENLRVSGCPVTITATYSNMENYKALEDFLNAAAAGSSGSVIIYEIHSDGGSKAILKMKIFYKTQFIIRSKMSVTRRKAT